MAKLQPIRRRSRNRHRKRRAWALGKWMWQIDLTPMQAYNLCKLAQNTSIREDVSRDLLRALIDIEPQDPIALCGFWLLVWQAHSYRYRRPRYDVFQMSAQDIRMWAV